MMDSGTLISLGVAIVIALGFIHLVWRARRVGRVDASLAVRCVNRQERTVYRFCSECRGYTHQAVLLDSIRRAGRYVCFSCEDQKVRE